MIGLLALASAASGDSKAPQWLYIDSGASWIARGLGRCGAENQSPVGFGSQLDGNTFSFSMMKTSTDRLWYRYPPVGFPLRLVNDGHSISVTFPEAYKGGLGISGASSVSKMFQDANFFRVYKLHVHAPAEHLYNGIRYPIEVQLIHQNPITQQTGILSTLFQEGVNRSALLDGLMEHGLPEHELDEVHINTEAAPILSSRGAQSMGIRLAELLTTWDGLTPTPDGVIHYNGSLTEPPCETPVKWWVRNSARSASLEQIRMLSEFTKRLDGPNGNARELQPVGDRKAELVSLVDIETEEIGGPVATPEGTVAAVEVPCNNMDEFTEQNYDDSEEIEKAKAKYVTSKLEAASMRVWKSQAQGKLMTSQGMYDNAAGPVEKINLKWDVIAKQQELDMATARAAEATAAEKTACDEALPIVCADSTSEACTNAMQLLSGAVVNVTNTTNVTVAPTTSPIIDTRLAYTNKVQLPTGEAANPFNDNIAERTERIGGPHGMASAPRDLTTSLREALAPGASVAEEAPATTLAPEPEANATDATNETDAAAATTTAATDAAEAPDDEAATSTTATTTAAASLVAADAGSAPQLAEQPKHWADYRPTRRVLLQRDA